MKDCLHCKQEAPKHFLADLSAAAASKAAKFAKNPSAAAKAPGQQEQNQASVEDTASIDPENQLRLYKI